MSAVFVNVFLGHNSCIFWKKNNAVLITNQDFFPIDFEIKGARQL